MVFEFIESWNSFRLDIVGFLAILGEGSVLANAQVATLSNWFLLPRLVPAPQALMRPTRPSKLESTSGWVTGVFSGNHRDHINHIGNIIVDAEKLPDFQVRIVRITREDKPDGTDEDDVNARSTSPLTGLNILGCVLSIILLALSIHYHDGMALLAVLLLSVLSSLIGVANRWRLKLPKRHVQVKNIPPGDVVIRYPQGSFLVVKCTEEVARELYFAPENIHYSISNPQVYRLMSLVGTLLLMGGVITLGNASNELQMAFAASFMILNAAYWLVAALPSKLHWDTTSYKKTMEWFDDELADGPLSGSVKAKAKVKKAVGHEVSNSVKTPKTFTQALWKAIVASKSIDWVRANGAAPQTEIWDKWLNAALERATESEYGSDHNESDVGPELIHVPNWDPQYKYTQIAQEFEKEKNDRKLEEGRLSSSRSSLNHRTSSFRTE